MEAYSISGVFGIEQSYKHVQLYMHMCFKYFSHEQLLVPIDYLCSCN